MAEWPSDLRVGLGGAVATGTDWPERIASARRWPLRDLRERFRSDPAREGGLHLLRGQRDIAPRGADGLVQRQSLDGAAGETPGDLIRARLGQRDAPEQERLRLAQLVVGNGAGLHG